MILYHGSNLVIREIDLSRSRKGKDFGKGFYLNANRDQAFSMAERTVRLLGEGEPILSAFMFDKDKALVSGVNVKIFDDYTEEWAEFIVMNCQNNSDIPAHPYDIVIGPIADDTVGVQIRRFVMGYMSAASLVKELRFRGDHAIQYYFGTQRAVDLLKAIDRL